MTFKIKTKIFFYLATGIFLTISGVSEWARTGFMWGGNYSIEGEAGGMNIIISIIGVIFIAAGYLEYDLHTPSTIDHSKTESDNDDLDH